MPLKLNFDDVPANQKVPSGMHKGEPWNTIPESYLYYMSNKEYGQFSELCKKEVERRKELLSKVAKVWKH